MSHSTSSPIHDHNRRAWNDRARRNATFTRPASDDDLIDPLSGLDGCGWLDGDVRGRRVLCLGAGGGRQSAMYAAAGAIVTVVDISDEMLALDRQVATQRKLDIEAVETSMDDLSMLPAGGFDVVVQPVSSCYLPDIGKVYAEVARVTVAGGVYVSQHKQPASLQATADPSSNGYELRTPYYHTGPLPAERRCRHREEGALEFLHRWEQIVGDLCRQGFVVEDLFEPLHADTKAVVGSFKHRSQFVAPYVRIKARRRGEKRDPDDKNQTTNASLWTPD